ncbi:MAG: 30S ribosomal protein S15 [Candidatus Thermoplasmatota archaeon]|nr:30S ribosomal protein S15 [Candidatus Thermoplasmatota archaeon]
MARIHARRRGKSGSRKPYRTAKPDWLKVDEKEVTTTIIDLYNKGYTTSRIGIELRDVHGVPDVKTAFGKSMYTILRENKVEMKLPEDIRILMTTAVRLHRHMDSNAKDLHNRRALQLTEAKIRRLGNYYKRTGVLPSTWSYSPKMAKLTVSD